MSNKQVNQLKRKYACAKGAVVVTTPQNSVAKFAREFNKSVVMIDRKQASKNKGQRKMKHKGKECY